jgi:hypothetical protein
MPQIVCSSLVLFFALFLEREATGLHIIREHQNIANGGIVRRGPESCHAAGLHLRGGHVPGDDQVKLVHYRGLYSEYKHSL